jgi:uncharacterized protein (TIGR03435 family)
MTLAGPVPLGGTQSVAAQSTTTSTPPAFAVTSVKPNVDGGPLLFGVQGRRFVATNVTVMLLVQRAYSTAWRGLLPVQIVGAPRWIDVDRFDIEAQLPEGGSIEPSQVMLMLRTLLADRFSLVTHRDTRTMPVFTLVVTGHRGSLKPSADQTPPTRLSTNQEAKSSTPDVPLRGVIRIVPAAADAGPGLIASGRAIAVSSTSSASDQPTIANLLQSYAGRPVMDKTGLKGLFDFRLQFVPDTLSASPDAAAPNADGTSLFTAVQEQFGLKLESARDAADVLVVDRLEKPSSN